MDKIIIVPTIREKNINDFLTQWESDWDTIIVIEDNPEKTFKLNGVTHYSWKEIKEELGENSWIISKRDSAIRCFGFYMAYKMNARYIFTLDDDCFPTSLVNGKLCQTHIEMMEKQPRWTESVLGTRTRGIPYANKGVLKNVVCNLGLWEDVADYDSITTLNFINKLPYFKPSFINRIFPTGQYFPLCGMNIAFKREIIPLMYFPLMGDGYPYRRADDIWCGIIMKKICDHLGYYVSVGEPVIRHMRASDPFVNLVKEAPGIKTNEWVWEEIDEINLQGKNCIECMKEIAAHLIYHKDEYFSKLGKAIGIWASLFGN